MTIITQEIFDTLPTDVKEKIKNTLRCYDEVFVTYEYGKYNVSVGVCLKAGYASDHKVIGTARQNDFYSLDEYMDIYEEEFGGRHVGRWNKAWADKRRAEEAGKTFIR